MKKLLLVISIFITATCAAQANSTQNTDDSTRSVLCPLKVLQIVKSCAIARDFPKGSKIAVGSYNKKKQYCTISVYTEDNGLLTNIYALIFYPATKELFQITDGRTTVAYDHTLDTEAVKYCW
jgi:uncharacterized lipoprotein YajG